MEFDVVIDPNQIVLEIPISENWFPTEPKIWNARAYFHGKWAELHNMQSPTAEKLAAFAASLPSFGCSCKEHFGELIHRIPPPFERGAISDLAWFAWTFRIRNEVRAILPVPLSPWDWNQALQEWRPHLLPRLTPISGLVAVTSIAPKLADSRRILDSWLRLGLSIVCVQPQSEAAAIRETYGDIVQVIEACEFASAYASPTVLISSLLDVADLLSSPILLINSDIEIDATPDNRQALIDAADYSRFSVGVRWNHPNVTHAEATSEPYGLDAFVISSEQARQLKKERYEIGKPMWDYWLPFSVRFNGHKIHKLPDKMFFHREHDQRWSQAEWMMGRSWFEAEHGTVFDWHQFRQELI